MRYVCWQPLLTDHQAYTYAALRERADGALMVMVARQDDAVRAAHGWVRQGGLTLEQELIPAADWKAWARRTLRAHPDAIHIFASPFESRRQMRVMAMACRMGCKVVLISEPFSTSSAGYLSDGSRLKGWLRAKLRPLFYRGLGAYFSPHLHAVFAISPRACRQYVTMGVPRARVFPFGYFIPAQTRLEASPAHREPPLRLVFVAGLIARKGLAIAMAAVRQLRGEGLDVTLAVYGPGSRDGYDFDEAITDCGSVPFGRAGEVIARYDALVLPSLFDGWGVVVNEALQAGTPVFCSDAVGAGSVVAAHGAGVVFPSEDAGALADALRRWIVEPERQRLARANARDVAPLLAPEIAAAFMHDTLAALDHGIPGPTAPWYPFPDDAR